MATRTLTDKIDNISKIYGFSKADINSSPTLLSLIDNYNGSYVDETSKPYNGAYHDSNSNTIVMGGANYITLTTLTHELGHATGQYPAMRNHYN